MLSVATYLFLNCNTWILAGEFHSLAYQIFINWYKSCFAELDVAMAINDMHYPSLKSVGIQLRLIALKNEMDAEPIALSSKYFIVTNKLLTSVSF